LLKELKKTSYRRKIVFVQLLRKHEEKPLAYCSMQLRARNLHFTMGKAVVKEPKVVALAQVKMRASV
jgi:hypothetical protein